MQDIHQINLFTNDLYQFTCSYSYFQSNKHEEEAIFQVFFRKYPFNGQYVVLGGIRAVKQFIQNLNISHQQITFLKTNFPHMKDQYFLWLQQHLKKPIKIKSPKQGQIVFAKQPLLTYIGQAGIVQLLETPILNLIGFSSLVTTNATRMLKAVYPKKCIQFGLRRAQGPDGALTASQFAYLGGFSGTSNLNAAMKFNIKCYGTMSHAYVTSFSDLAEAEDFQINGVNFVQKVRDIQRQLHFDHTHKGELASFIMFAKSFPDNYFTLIDTYNTLKSGILNTIIVVKAMFEIRMSVQKIGVRLDSGDLVAQSKACRQIWNQYFPNGPQLLILASDDLHEERLKQMQQQKNEVNIYAIGTHISTCKKQPALGLVCKLVSFNNQPKIKISSDRQKTTLPYNKNVYRVWCTDQENSSYDLITMEEEVITNNVTIYDHNSGLKPIQSIIKNKRLLNEYWDQEPPYDTLQKCKQHLENTKKYVINSLSLNHPEKHKVMMTQKYYQNFQKVLNKNKVQ